MSSEKSAETARLTRAGELACLMGSDPANFPYWDAIAGARVDRPSKAVAGLIRMLSETTRPSVPKTISSIPRPTKSSHCPVLLARMSNLIMATSVTTRPVGEVGLIVTMSI